MRFVGGCSALGSGWVPDPWVGKSARGDREDRHNQSTSHCVPPLGLSIFENSQEEGAVPEPGLFLGPAGGGSSGTEAFLLSVLTHHRCGNVAMPKKEKERIHGSYVRGDDELLSNGIPIQLPSFAQFCAPYNSPKTHSEENRRTYQHG